MKNTLKQMILSNIAQWTDKDIYAISLYVYDDYDNPCKPTVTLGYNTETQVEKETPNAGSEQEARWNYAFWLQNEFFCFGVQETADTVRKWLNEKHLPFYEDDDEAWNDDDICDKAMVVTEFFVNELIEIVKEIHQSGILKEKFGKELPIIIHELEYYDEIAEQNVKANGEFLPKEFIPFCKGELI